MLHNHVKKKREKKNQIFFVDICCVPFSVVIGCLEDICIVVIVSSLLREEISNLYVRLKKKNNFNRFSLTPKQKKTQVQFDLVRDSRPGASEDLPVSCTGQKHSRQQRSK